MKKWIRYLMTFLSGVAVAVASMFVTGWIDKHKQRAEADIKRPIEERIQNEKIHSISNDCSTMEGSIIENEKKIIEINTKMNSILDYVKENNESIKELKKYFTYEPDFNTDSSDNLCNR